MAKGVRDAERRLSPLAVSALVVCGVGCGAQNPAPAKKPPAKPATDAPALADPASLVKKLLERHHGPILGTFDNFILRLREQQDQPREDSTQLTLALPARMRVDHPDRRVDLWIDGVGWRCQPKLPPQRLTTDDGLAKLTALRHHARALALLPLYRAEQIKRVGPGVLSLILPKGETWRLQVDEDKLRIIELRGPAGPVRFESFLNTGISVMPTKATLGDLGPRFVQIVASNLFLDGSLFDDPFLPVDVERAKRPHSTAHTSLRGSRDLPTRAELQDIDRRVFLVLDDPGGWEDRCDLIMGEGEALGMKGQSPDGLPTYAHLNGNRVLMIPFRPDPEQGNRPYVREPGQRINHVAAHRAIVVCPPPGTWAEVREAARRLIDDYLDREGLTKRGMPLMIPFVEPVQVPSSKDLQRLQVRFEQGVEG